MPINPESYDRDYDPNVCGQELDGDHELDLEHFIDELDEAEEEYLEDAVDNEEIDTAYIACVCNNPLHHEKQPLAQDNGQDDENC